MSDSAHYAAEPTHREKVDLRRAPRFMVEMRVRVILKDTAPANLFGQASDISEYGMALMVPKSLEIGTHIEIEFSLPITQHKLTLAAEIKNRQNFRYGVEFRFPTKNQREAILKACRMLL